MYDVPVEWHDFEYPWQRLGFQSRLKALRDRSEGLFVVYLYQQEDNSTFRYRVYNMWESAGMLPDVGASFFFLSEMPRVFKHFDKIDVLVIARVLWSQELDAVLYRAQASGIRTIYDIDDLVFDVRELPTIMNTLGVKIEPAAYDYWFSYVSRIYLAASYCDGYVAPTPSLAKRIANEFDKPCRVLPSGLNRQQLEVSQSIWRMKRTNHDIFRERPILVGYFSGTPSHNNDYGSIAAELHQLLLEDCRIRLMIVGYMQMPELLRGLEGEGRILRHPLQNYLNLQALIGSCDANIVPLVVNPFTNCKSEIKYFEASVVGTPTVAARTGVYEALIHEEKDGFLSSAGEWKEKIRAAVGEGSRGDLPDAARKKCLERYSPEATAERLGETLRGIAGSPT